MINLDDYSVIPQAQLDAEKEAAFRAAKAEADAKITEVLQFLSTNEELDMRQIVKKFGLDWALGKEFANGLGRINFYTDETQRFFVCDTYDEVSAWFRT